MNLRIVALHLNQTKKWRKASLALQKCYIVQQPTFISYWKDNIRKNGLSRKIE
jgi:hypothetical protein